MSYRKPTDKEVRAYSKKYGHSLTVAKKQLSRVNIRVASPIARRFRIYCDKHGMRIGGQLEILMKEFLNKEKTKEPSL